MAGANKVGVNKARGKQSGAQGKRLRGVGFSDVVRKRGGACFDAGFCRMPQKCRQIFAVRAFSVYNEKKRFS